MYGNKTIEDVVKYLYEQKQDDLAKVVLQQIRDLADAQAQRKVCNLAHGNQPFNDKPLNPITYPRVWMNTCQGGGPCA